MTKIRDFLAKIIIIIAILGGLSQFAEAKRMDVHYAKFNKRLKLVSSFCIKAPRHRNLPWVDSISFAKIWARATRSTYWGKVNPRVWSKRGKGGIAANSKAGCLGIIRELKTKGYRIVR